MASADGVSYWTHDRAELHQRLRDVSPRLAGMYRRCFRLLDETADEPDEELARLASAAHCMREVMNRLADVLPDAPARAVTPTISSRELAVQLAAATSDQPSLFTPQEGESVVAIPRHVVGLIGELIGVARQETATTRERDALIITKSSNSGAPVIDQWVSARNFFVRIAHIGGFVTRGRETKSPPSDAEILGHIEIVENALRSRLVGFFEARREISELLREINSTEEGK